MKFSIDVNIFLYACDSTSRYFDQAKKFLDKLIDEQGDCYLLWDTIYAFIRISTHAAIFKKPLSAKIALENIDNARNALGATMLAPDDTSWEIYQRLAQEQVIKGKGVPDALLVSVLEANGVTRLFTADQDFWKFQSIRAMNPFS